LKETGAQNKFAASGYEGTSVAATVEEPPVVGGPQTAMQTMKLIGKTRRLLAVAGIDRAVVYGILSVARGIVSGPITVLLVAAYFTPELQGFYYTFASLLALQVFVDLGLGTVIIQFASHEWAHLGFDEQGRVVGSSEAISRLVSLWQVALRWYTVAGVIVGLGLGVAGYVFFSQAPNANIHWVAPWFGLCLMTGISLCMVPVWSLLEGCNQVSQVYGFKLGQGILVSVVTWVAIATRSGLWTPAIATTAGLVWSILFLRRRYWPFIKQLFVPASGPLVSWKFELWPMQWKIALSWMSGYLSFSLFTPMLFRYSGAVVAGQMGMTWSLVSILTGISSTWSMSKAPRFGVLVARKDYKELDSLFYRLSIASFLIAACSAAAIWGGVYFLYAFKYPIAQRFLPPLPTGIFLAATVLLQVSYPQAFYLRAHKQEPFLWLSITAGMLIALSNWLLGRFFSATGMAVGYLAVVALVSLPVGTLIWYRRRLEWHADAPRG
jgi:O-antigen/teichoic acid export membrane protein